MSEHDESPEYARQDQMITFRASKAFQEWLQREAFLADKSASDLIRAAVIAGMPLVKALRGMDRLDVDDIRSEWKAKQTKV